MKLFFQCHPEVRIKWVHNLSVNQAMGANPTVIHKFYDQLQAEIEHLNITNPQHI